ncbi:hypothetical protein DYBT9275_04977 [Dyadobacter sp. CECT 9275]|uniref:Peptidase M56 domain-containing protein n=1 Tax=Dyadobacter helix TaxID=2822344 RepID=A0A916JGG8_9BACT|nr:M56 family metallopeptidase [Dyadobacter sp. CECT 9275]CAG5011574.1 hypothetical protein DYBT9275_04977 [Dyadobacter sp. CECT 9275]
MKFIFEFLSSPAATAFGWMLVHSLWQASLLSVIAFALFHILRNRSAAQRYNTGITLLAVQIVTSIATFCYYLNLVSQSAVQHYYVPAASNVTANAYWQPTNQQIPMATRILFWLNNHIQELVICWLIGAALLMLRFAGGWIYTERLKYTSRIVMDQQWRARFGVLTAKLNITKSIEFRESARIASPIVIGVLQPAVLIPLGLLTGFSVSQIEAILTHELAHIRRNDYLVNLLQSVAEVIFFFHPAIWWLSEKIRTERENCCDDIALSVCGDKMSLVNALVKVAEWQTSGTLAMAFASRKPLLLQRIRRVLGVSSKSTGIFGIQPTSFLFLAMLIGLSLYAIGQDKTPSKRKKADKRIEKKTNKRRNANADLVPLQQIQLDGDPVSLAMDLTAPSPDAAVPLLDLAVTNPDLAIPALGNISLSTNLSDLNLWDFASTSSWGDDSTQQKRNEFHQRMQALQNEMEPLQRRMEDLNLRMEKENFEMERYQREIEKLEWKKERLMESREEIMEKRSALFDADSKNGKSKFPEGELEKQVEAFEQQIKAQEQQITEFNSKIVSARKQAEVYEESEAVKSIKSEIDEIRIKMEKIGAEMGVASLGIEKLYPGPPPRPAKVPRPPKAPRADKISTKPAPPAPKAVPNPKAAPTPPTPPGK